MNNQYDDVLEDEGLPYLGVLKEMLKDIPDNTKVFIRCCYNPCGDIVEAVEASKNIYGFFEKEIPCVIIEPADDCYKE